MAYAAVVLMLIGLVRAFLAGDWLEFSSGALSVAAGLGFMAIIALSVPRPKED
jgi:hypothetical protein